jgi:pyruvate,orthophosphate dikinase
MFFEGERIGLMREMIFAEPPAARRAVLDRLLPLQRADFAALFRSWRQARLHPPLRPAAPRVPASDRQGLRDLAEHLSRPLSDVEARVEALREYNPMLGLRGVRLGITVPEIYDMQARAIFEAAVLAGRDGEPVVPEVMIPLVSAKREVEIVKARVDAVAAAVRAERAWPSPTAWASWSRRPAPRSAPPRSRSTRPSSASAPTTYPDDLWPVARRRRAIPGHLCGAGGVRGGPVPLPRPRRRGRALRIGAERGRDGRPT